MRKPYWLDKKFDLSSCHEVKRMLRDLSLHTVCEEALCPNISECFARRTATFMILGDVCTRRCRFCSVKKGTPSGCDESEAQRLRQAVEILGLNYVVITSPTRDDLEDGGAAHYARVAFAIKEAYPQKKVEFLIPDFYRKPKALDVVCAAGVDVIGHNIETVPGLYTDLRPGADYRRSLNVLKAIKDINPSVFTRSGLMLGLGESDDEVFSVMRDLRRAGCDFINLGQYLSPSVTHYPVAEYVPPARFDFYRKYASALGFRDVKSAPYVRSSYQAHSSFGPFG